MIQSISTKPRIWYPWKKPSWSRALGPRWSQWTWPCGPVASRGPAGFVLASVSAHSRPHLCWALLVFPPCPAVLMTLSVLLYDLSLNREVPLDIIHRWCVCVCVCTCMYLHKGLLQGCSWSQKDTEQASFNFWSQESLEEHITFLSLFSVMNDNFITVYNNCNCYNSSL